ncbi:MAG TPA: BrnT family toxin [Bryobacteraceae bacterium]|nr:BrnT family toxin [Bryobacteraceae bacterium]
MVEWDSVKARANLRKDGVRFADAVIALEDGSAITVREEREDEDRLITIGMDGLARILVVVYTWRGETIRLISARLATATERRQYERGA